MKGKNKISLVVPCFNEEAVIPTYYDAISPVIKNLKTEFSLEIELIFVDDGSTDQTLALLKKIQENDKSITVLSLSRNFGKEGALYAGFQESTGDFIGMMDVDLQDPVELLREMYLGIVDEGYDCVAARRDTRKGEPLIRTICAYQFYKLINMASDVKIVEGARDFRLMTRQMLNSILELGEYNRFSKGIFAWVGYDTKWLSYQNIKRAKGKTKWSFRSLFKYSIEGIFAFSTVPLNIMAFIGLFLCFLSFVFIFIVIGKTLLFGDPVQGYPSMACLILFIGGIQLFCFGILGKYVAKIALETKKRPIYIIKNKYSNRENQ